MREFFYLLFLTVSLAHATDGDLDASFGSNGDIVLAPNDASLSAYAVAVQSDGGILVAGNRWAFTQPSQQNQAVVWRFLPNGNVDSSFGSHGVSVVAFDSTLLMAVRSLSDGDILAAGNFGGFGVARFHSDGSLDTQFGTIDSAHK